MNTFAEKYGPWAVVTGAAAGVGLAYTEELIERGLGVVLVDVSPDVVEVAAGLAGTTRSLVADVSEPAWLDALTEVTADIDVGLAVANAGLSFVGNYLDMTAAQRAQIIAVNVGGTDALASWALPAMVERGRGGFVATSSGSALCGTALVGLYSATKAFAVNLIEAIGWELRDSGVDTLAVIAPSMDTPGFRSSNANPDGMFVAPIAPRAVIAKALDALPAGGRWLADEGLEFAATVERSQRVDMMGQTMVAMYR